MRDSSSSITPIMSSQPKHTLTLIPGPIEYDDAVLEAMSHPSVSHTATEFVQAFQSVLKHLRTLFFANASDSQVFVLAGSGTVGWDLAGTNFVEQNDKVLVLNTGYFAAAWGDSLRVLGADVSEIKPEVGFPPKLAEVEKALKETKYHAITITHVDTSTGVLTDVKKVAELVKRVSPETLIFVDGVCSVAVEELRFDDWGLDFVLTGPQKGIGAPAGLSISAASGRALNFLKNRKTPVHGYFLDLNRWIPIMQAYESGKPAYFSTPAVENVYALKASLEQYATSVQSIEARWKANIEVSNKVKDAVEALGLKLVVCCREAGAHGLSTVYLPEGVALPDFLGLMLKNNIQLAGGLIQPIATRYFRIGHMGVSAFKYGHIDQLLQVLPKVIAELKQ